MSADDQDVTGPVRRVQDWLRETSTRVAVALILVGCLWIFVEGQTPDRLYWTGHTTVGTIRDGLVYYRVHGELFTLNDTDALPDKPTPITVFYDASDPSQALYDKPGRWLDAGAILVWFVAAAAVLIISTVRRRRTRRRAASEPDWLQGYLKRDP